jgi:dephospho-CoA kinase
MSVASVILVVGPAGVGKDDVFSWIKNEYNFEWVDIDQVGQFEAKGLQSEWNRFKRLDAAPLASALRRRVMEVNAIGAVMSLPSDQSYHARND